jgi:hypothetical protein
MRRESLLAVLRLSQPVAIVGAAAAELAAILEQKLKNVAMVDLRDARDEREARRRVSLVLDEGKPLLVLANADLSPFGALFGELCEGQVNAGGGPRRLLPGQKLIVLGEGEPAAPVWSRLFVLRFRAEAVRPLLA